jgi:signal transduction histidine kinase
MKRRVPLARIWGLSLMAAALVLVAATWYAGEDPGIVAQAQATTDANSLAEQLEQAATGLVEELALAQADIQPIRRIRFDADGHLLEPKPLPMAVELVDQAPASEIEGPSPAASWLAEARVQKRDHDWPAVMAAVEDGERAIHQGEKATRARLLLLKAEAKMELDRPREAAVILAGLRTSAGLVASLDGISLRLKTSLLLADAKDVAKQVKSAIDTRLILYQELLGGLIALPPGQLAFEASMLQDILEKRGDTERIEKTEASFRLAAEIIAARLDPVHGHSLVIRSRVIFLSQDSGNGYLYDSIPIHRLARRRLEEMLPITGAFSLVVGTEPPNGAVQADLMLPPGFGRGWRLVLSKPEVYTLPADRRRALLLGGTLLIVIALTMVGIWGARALRRRAELERVRSDFIAGVSHELRTPAASIALLAGNLVEGRVVNESRRMEYYHALQRDALRLQRLVADVLDASRLERGVFEVDRQLVDPRSMLVDLAVEQRPRLADAGLELRVEIADHLPETPLDLGAVERAVANLIENARKYAIEGKLIILRAFEEGGHLYIEVEDRGPGIPEHLRERLFQTYERGEAEHTQVAGAGLGLSLVRETLIAHGGRAEILDATPAPGETSFTGGALFRLRFPVSS